MAYLKARVWSPKDFRTALEFMKQEQTDGQVAADWFLQTRPKAWSKWVPVEAATKIKAAF